MKKSECESKKDFSFFIIEREMKRETRTRRTAAFVFVVTSLALWSVDAQQPNTRTTTINNANDLIQFSNDVNS